MANQLRLIGGEWKRRVLRFESVAGLRPTPDRLRETLFNWLMWDLAGRRVLDVCAGSGALGFEALSRGAAQATLIEPHRAQARRLQDNAQVLAAQTRLIVLNQTAQQALPRLQREAQPFDGVFLDPPYALNLWAELAHQVDPLLSAQAWIYVEADRPLDTLGLPAHWTLQKSTRVGQIFAGLLQRKAQETASALPAINSDRT